jgi:hypothetical protein
MLLVWVRHLSWSETLNSRCCWFGFDTSLGLKLRTPDVAGLGITDIACDHTSFLCKQYTHSLPPNSQCTLSNSQCTHTHTKPLVCQSVVHTHSSSAHWVAHPHPPSISGETLPTGEALHYPSESLIQSIVRRSATRFGSSEPVYCFWVGPVIFYFGQNRPDRASMCL